jgi:hypothetical protein
MSHGMGDTNECVRWHQDRWHVAACVKLAGFSQAQEDSSGAGIHGDSVFGASEPCNFVLKVGNDVVGIHGIGTNCSG